MVVTNAGRSTVSVRSIQLEYFANLELNKVHFTSLHFEYRTHTGRAFAVLYVTLSQNTITGSPTSSSPAIISLPQKRGYGTYSPHHAMSVTSQGFSVVLGQMRTSTVRSSLPYEEIPRCNFVPSLPGYTSTHLVSPARTNCRSKI